MKSGGGRYRALLCAAAICLSATPLMAQSRQPLFDGSPIESLTRLKNRVVRSLRGEEPPRRRATRSRHRHPVKQAPPVPSVADVPRPKPRPAVLANGVGNALDERSDEAATSSQADAAATIGDGGTTAAANAVKPDGSTTRKPAAEPPVPIKALPTLERTPVPESAKDEANPAGPSPFVKAGDQPDTADGAADKSPSHIEGAADVISPAQNADGGGEADIGNGSEGGLDGDEAGHLPLAEIPLPEGRPVPPAGNAGDAPAAAAKPEADDEPNSTAKLKSRIPDITPAAAVEAAAAVEDAKACEGQLKARGTTFSVGESIAEGECGVLRPVTIDRLSSGVEVRPATKLLCRSALALDEWMSDSVVKAAKENFPDDKVVRFRHASTYVCRHRSSDPKISEHARGSAIDIAGFVFESGRAIGVERHEEGSPEAKFQKAIRTGACGPFKTVLGPGTDADHSTHFHLDIAARRNGYEYCK